MHQLDERTKESLYQESALLNVLYRLGFTLLFEQRWASGTFKVPAVPATVVGENNVFNGTGTSTVTCLRYSIIRQFS